MVTLRDLTKIHAASLALLGRKGVVFEEPEACALLRRHGVRVDGATAFPDEAAVVRALEAAPPRFRLADRGPRGPLAIGGGSKVLLPTVGPAFLRDEAGRLRRGTRADHEDLCKLVHTSPCLGMNSTMLVQPSDVAPRVAHLAMLLNAALLCDRPFLAVTSSLDATKDSLEMAALLWGGWDEVGDRHVLLGLCNCRSPLIYGPAMTASLTAFARRRQPVIAASMVMAGLTGPISLAGTLALQNAEILAALVLVQCASPGSPFVYGGISCAVDPRSGVPALGAPETVALMAATLRLARFYGLPCRTGGALTDAPAADAQAGSESAVALSNALQGGADVILHACGMLGGYDAIGIAKLVLDEDLCAMLLGPGRIRVDDDALDVALIERVGHGGHYMAEPETADACSTAFVLPRTYRRKGTPPGDDDLEALAVRVARARLAAYVSPPVDAAVRADLRRYAAGRGFEA